VQPVSLNLWAASPPATAVNTANASGGIGQAGRAQRICVMEDGRVAEDGTHDILVARGGLSARLAVLKFGP